eukprot:scaffold518_cov388-Prasinococcus_capsulatus_cf.AAC.48
MQVAPSMQCSVLRGMRLRVNHKCNSWIARGGPAGRRSKGPELLTSSQHPEMFRLALHMDSNASDLGAAWLMTSLRHPVDRIRSHYHYKFHKTHQWLDYDPDSAASTDTQDGAPESSGGYVVQGNEHLTSPSITQPWEHEGMTVRQYYGGVITLEEFARTPGKDNQHIPGSLPLLGWTNLNDDGQQMASPEDAALLAMYDRSLLSLSMLVVMAHLLSLAEKWNVSMQMLKVQLFPRAFSTIPEGMLAGGGVPLSCT